VSWSEGRTEHATLDLRRDDARAQVRVSDVDLSDGEQHH